MTHPPTSPEPEPQIIVQIPPLLVVILLVLGLMIAGLLALELKQLRHPPRRSTQVLLPAGLKLLSLGRLRGQISYTTRPLTPDEPLEVYTVDADGDIAFNTADTAADELIGHGGLALPDAGESLSLQER